ncbi:hypothetical protein HK101_010327 [Irineochytrium annulatum]|nr:hypothetical protein HK101_010327 [Irineochytrium annulatum]
MLPPAALLFVGVNGFLHALDKRTGQEAWQHTLTGRPYLPVLIQPDCRNNTLLVACGENLRCIDAATGELQYENRLQGIGIGYAHIALGRDADRFRENVERLPHMPLPPHMDAKGSTTDPEDVVYVAVNHMVRAVRISDGSDLWEFRTPMAAGCSSQPHLLSEDGLLYVAGNGRIFALDCMTGNLVWQADVKHREYCILATMRSGDPTNNIPNHLRGQKASSGGKSDPVDALMCAAHGYVTLVRRSNGEVLPLPNGGKKVGEVAMNGRGFVTTNVVAVPSVNSFLAAAGVNLRRINVETGHVVWENRLKGMGLGCPSLLVGSGVPDVNVTAAVEQPSSSKSSWSQAGVRDVSELVFVAVHGQVRAVRAVDGSDVWGYDPGLGKRIELPHMFVEDGMVFMVGQAWVVALDAFTGEVVHAKKEIHNHRVFAASFRSGSGETNRSSMYSILAKKLADEEDKRRRSG